MSRAEFTGQMVMQLTSLFVQADTEDYNMRASLNLSRLILLLFWNPLSPFPVVHLSMLSFWSSSSSAAAARPASTPWMLPTQPEAMSARTGWAGFLAALLTFSGLLLLQHHLGCTAGSICPIFLIMPHNLFNLIGTQRNPAANKRIATRAGCMTKKYHRIRKKMGVYYWFVLIDK